jgi:hypothetical protein
MADRELQSDPAAHAVAEDVAFVDLEVVQQCGRVVRHLLVAERPVDIGGMPVTLLFGSDHSPHPG